MRNKIVIIGIIFTILSGVILENRARAQTYVDIDLFYEELSPYGGWSPHVEFGDVWQPYNVGPEWIPYTDGRWEFSDQGWIWISYEPWGWATYHYGRWVYDDYQGWIWIPGTTWAPAWVSWQQSPEYIGWSPLPPDRGFFVEIGINFNIYNSYYYKPYHYKHHYKKHHYYHDYYYNQHNYRPPVRHSVFLPSHKFGHHKHAGKAAIPNPLDTIVFRNSKNITNIKRVNNKVINYGPDKHYIEKLSNRKLVTHTIVDKNNVVLRGNKNVNVVNGGAYNVYRPKIQRKTSKNPFIKTKDSARFERSSQGNKEHRVTNKIGVPNKMGVRGNSNIPGEKTYKHNQQQNINKHSYKTSPNSNTKNKFNQDLRQQSSGQTSGLTKSGNTPRAVKSGVNKFSQNRRSAGSKNTPNVKSYNKPQVKHNNKIENKSNKKTNRSNYSSKNKSISSGNGRAFQTKSHSTTNKSYPSSNSRSFSMR